MHKAYKSVFWQLGVLIIEVKNLDKDTWLIPWEIKPGCDWGFERGQIAL